MKTSEIRLLSVEELRTKLADARQELMNLRFQVVTGQLTDTSRLKAKSPGNRALRNPSARA